MYHKVNELTNHKIILFLLLYTMFCINAIIDHDLTDIALDNGFYETNDFTNKYGTTIHYFTLTYSVGLLCLFMVIFLPPPFTIVFLSGMCLIWVFNNIYSLVIL